MFHLYISLLDLLIWLYRLRREEMKENWDSCVRWIHGTAFVATHLAFIDPIQQE